MVNCICIGSMETSKDQAKSSTALYWELLHYITLILTSFYCIYSVIVLSVIFSYCPAHAAVEP